MGNVKAPVGFQELLRHSMGWWGYREAGWGGLGHFFYTCCHWFDLCVSSYSDSDAINNSAIFALRLRRILSTRERATASSRKSSMQSSMS